MAAKGLGTAVRTRGAVGLGGSDQLLKHRAATGRKGVDGCRALHREQTTPNGER